MLSIVGETCTKAFIAALSLAALGFAEAALQKGLADANSSRVVIQAQQVLAAAELYRATNGVWPASMDALLKPAAFLAAVPEMEGHTWTMPVPSQPVFVLNTLQPRVCKGINNKMYGHYGVLAVPHAGVSVQCYGPALEYLQTVAAKDSYFLNHVGRNANANPAVGRVAETPIPTLADDPEWVVLPDAAGTSQDCIARTADSSLPFDEALASRCDVKSISLDYRTAFPDRRQPFDEE